MRTYRYKNNIRFGYNRILFNRICFRLGNSFIYFLAGNYSEIPNSSVYYHRQLSEFLG